MLKQSLTKAVETLTGLLNSDDDRVKRLICNDIISHVLNRQELDDLTERLKTLEGRLEGLGQRHL